MSKIKLSIVTLLMFLTAAAGARGNSYVCELAEGASARYGVQAITLAFTVPDGHSKVVVTFYDKSMQVIGGSSVVYSIAGNIHTGRFAGYARYSPNIYNQPTTATTQKLNVIAIRKTSDRKVAVLSFPESKNAHYVCQ